LFLIYVNAITNALCKAVIKLFAHDANLFLHNFDPAQLFDNANTCFAQLCEWFSVNRWSLHRDKTCYSVFLRSRKDVEGYKLYINGKIIQNV